MKELVIIEENDFFYNEAIRFYESGVIVAQSVDRINEEIDLFSPIIYLYRHSIELMLKALIINYLVESGESNWTELKLQPHNKKISRIHSILELFDIAKLLNGDFTIWAEENDDINSLVEELDKYDVSSTFFRYPYDKKGNLNKRNMTESLDDLMVGMPCSLANFIYHEGLEKFSCLHREQELDYLEESLPYLIKRLSDIYLKERKSGKHKTIDYYEANAKKFVSETVSVDFQGVRKRFTDKLPYPASILDLGCGSGRDTKAFFDQGYQVDAIDGSEELCKLATDYTGIQVRHMLFQELSAIDKYDGIWACSSILHLPKDELINVMRKMTAALKPNGIIYTSFKYGTFSGERNGRYFTDMTEMTFADFISDIEALQVEEQWISSDVRPGRGEERWLNLILRKK